MLLAAQNLSSKRVSRGISNSKSIKCFHDCLKNHCDTSKDDLQAIPLRLCPGSNMLGCSNYLVSTCFIANHRCGMGDCRCHCGLCKAAASFQSVSNNEIAAASAGDNIHSTEKEDTAASDDEITPNDDTGTDDETAPNNNDNGGGAGDETPNDGTGAGDEETTSIDDDTGGAGDTGDNDNGDIGGTGDEATTNNDADTAGAAGNETTTDNDTAGANDNIESSPNVETTLEIYSRIENTLHTVDGSGVSASEAVKIVVAKQSTKYQPLGTYQGPDPRSKNDGCVSNVLLVCRVWEQNKDPTILLCIWIISKTELISQHISRRQLVTLEQSGAIWRQGSRMETAGPPAVSLIATPPPFHDNSLNGAPPPSTLTPDPQLRQDHADNASAVDEMKVSQENVDEDVVDVTNDRRITISKLLDDDAPGEDAPVMILKGKDPKVIHSCIPAERLVEEMRISEEFSELYTALYEDVPHKILSTAGGLRRFSAFHHIPSNILATSENKGKKKEYIDLREHAKDLVLYRYDVKGMLCTILQSTALDDTNGKFQQRVFISMCQLESNEYPGRSVHEYILVDILSTMCVDNRNDFIVFNKRVGDLEIWEGMDRIKHYWCRPDMRIDRVALSGIDLEARRQVLFLRKSWIFDLKRCLPIDTKNPSKRDGSGTSKTFKESIPIWRIHLGPQRPGTPQSTESDRQTLSRSDVLEAQKQERLKKEAVEKQKEEDRKAALKKKQQLDKQEKARLKKEANDAHAHVQQLKKAEESNKRDIKTINTNVKTIYNNSSQTPTHISAKSDEYYMSAARKQSPSNNYWKHIGRVDLTCDKNEDSHHRSPTNESDKRSCNNIPLKLTSAEDDAEVREHARAMAEIALKGKLQKESDERRAQRRAAMIEQASFRDEELAILAASRRKMRWLDADDRMYTHERTEDRANIRAKERFNRKEQALDNEHERERERAHDEYKYRIPNKRSRDNGKSLSDSRHESRHSRESGHRSESRRSRDSKRYDSRHSRKSGHRSEPRYSRESEHRYESRHSRESGHRSEPRYSRESGHRSESHHSLPAARRGHYSSDESNSSSVSDSECSLDYQTERSRSTDSYSSQHRRTEESDNNRRSKRSRG